MTTPTDDHTHGRGHPRPRPPKSPPTFGWVFLPRHPQEVADVEAPQQHRDPPGTEQGRDPPGGAGDSGDMSGGHGDTCWGHGDTPWVTGVGTAPVGLGDVSAEHDVELAGPELELLEFLPGVAPEGTPNSPGEVTPPPNVCDPSPPPPGIFDPPQSVPTPLPAPQNSRWGGGGAVLVLLRQGALWARLGRGRGLGEAPPLRGQRVPGGGEG